MDATSVAGGVRAVPVAMHVRVADCRVLRRDARDVHERPGRGAGIDAPEMLAEARARAEGGAARAPERERRDDRRLVPRDDEARRSRTRSRPVSWFEAPRPCRAGGSSRPSGVDRRIAPRAAIAAESAAGSKRPSKRTRPQPSLPPAPFGEPAATIEVDVLRRLQARSPRGSGPRRHRP